MWLNNMIKSYGFMFADTFRYNGNYRIENIKYFSMEFNYKYSLFHYNKRVFKSKALKLLIVEKIIESIIIISITK